MRPTRRAAFGCCWSVLLLTGGWQHCLAADPPKLAAAKEAAGKAAAEEQAIAKEHNAKDMARAATAAIVEAAQATLARANAGLAEAEAALKEKTEGAKAAVDRAAAEKDPAKKKALEQAAAKAAAEKAAAQQRRDQRAAFVKKSQDQLAIDTGVAERALADEQVARAKYRAKQAATRAANRLVLEETAVAAAAAVAPAQSERAQAAPAAKAAAAVAKAAAELANAEKDPALKKALEAEAARLASAQSAAEKLLAEKTKAAQAAATNAARAHAAVLNSRAAYAQDLAGEALAAKNAAAEALRQKRAAATAAASQAAAETDAAKKASLQTAAAKAATEVTEAEKALAAKTEALQAALGNAAEALVTARGGLKPLSPKDWDYAKARHLLVRAGFGATPPEVARLHALGLHAAVDELVDFHRRPVPNIPFEAAPPERPDPLEGSFAPDLRNKFAGQRQAAEAGQTRRLRLWWLKRMAESPRPLQEKLTLFWHGHFATQYSVVPHSYIYYQQNQLFREHAAANFGGLLYGIVHDPVMIRYLDNNKNVKGHPNENLAREIMELFAMGADQGYTEKDIREAARALTGYTYDHYTGQFRFVATQHDEGPKTIFGRTGNYTGDDLVQLILEQPATARFIARKLFEYFAYQGPSEATNDALAVVLRNNQYELRPLLKNLFLSQEFYSPKAMGTQIKNPVQLVVGMMRDLGVSNVADYAAMDSAIRGMGQELLEPPDVKGWREGRSWINANRIFLRYNSLAEILKTVPNSGRAGVDLVRVLETAGCKSGVEIVDYLTKTCLVQPLDAAKRQELVAFLGEVPAPAQWAAQRDTLNGKLLNLLVLMLSMPEYQVT